jgi:hypothetical protein
MTKKKNLVPLFCSSWEQSREVEAWNGLSAFWFEEFFLCLYETVKPGFLLERTEQRVPSNEKAEKPFPASALRLRSRNSKLLHIALQFNKICVKILQIRPKRSRCVDYTLLKSVGTICKVVDCTSQVQS